MRSVAITLIILPANGDWHHGAKYQKKCVTVARLFI